MTPTPTPPSWAISGIAGTHCQSAKTASSEVEISVEDGGRGGGGGGGGCNGGEACGPNSPGLLVVDWKVSSSIRLSVESRPCKIGINQNIS